MLSLLILTLALQLAAATGVAATALPAQKHPAGFAARHGTETHVDSVWFATNRAFSGLAWRNDPGPLSYGVRTFEVRRADPDDPDPDVRLRPRLRDEALLDGRAFVESVDASAMATDGWDGAVLIYVHGYASSIDEATGEVAEMRRRAGFGGPAIVFAWPSLPLGVTWPAVGRLFTNAYWRDSTMAAASAGAFVDALTMLARELGPERVVLAAHSMGNQLLAAALDDPRLREQLAATPLRAMAFLSPDLDAAHFRDVVVPAARPLTRRTVLYGARNDRMLLLSSIVHGGSPRAGRLSKVRPRPEGLEVVDMTDGRSVGNGWPGLFDTNHAFRRERTALADFFGVVVRGAPEAQRSRLGVMERAADGTWVATEAPIPPG
jgi:esterase/lipase superfamily enzyme